MKAEQENILSSNQQLLSPNSEEKQTKLYLNTQRSIFITSVTAVAGATLTLFTGASLPAVAGSTIISALLGLAFTIIEGFDQHVRKLQRDIIDNEKIIESLKESYIDEIDKLSSNNKKEIIKVKETMSDFKDLVHHTSIILNFYSSIHKLITEDNAQKHLIYGFLEQAMNRPVFTQPMSIDDFFELAQKGIEQTDISWQAIHQGSISKLPDFLYLKHLKTTVKPLKKQRIVILDDEDSEELKNYEKVDKFLRDTEGTDSYWIKQNVFYEIFDIPSHMRLDDAALHDGKLLILRQRDNQLGMLALEGQGDRACVGIIRAFKRLNFDLEHNQLGGMFKKIERPPHSGE